MDQKEYRSNKEGGIQHPSMWIAPSALALQPAKCNVSLFPPSGCCFGGSQRQFQRACGGEKPCCASPHVGFCWCNSLAECHPEQSEHLKQIQPHEQRRLLDCTSDDFAKALPVSLQRKEVNAYLHSSMTGAHDTSASGMHLCQVIEGQNVPSLRSQVKILIGLLIVSLDSNSICKERSDNRGLGAARRIEIDATWLTSVLPINPKVQKLNDCKV